MTTVLIAGQALSGNAGWPTSQRRAKGVLGGHLLREVSMTALVPLTPLDRLFDEIPVDDAEQAAAAFLGVN